MLCWFCIVQNFWQATKASLLWGEAPVQVVSHLCHRIVQWLCAADCKHPCLVWGDSPTLSPGIDAGRVCPRALQGRIQVVEQSRCRTHRQQTTTIAQMQSQQSIHSLSPRERGLGFRQGCRDRTPKGFARTQSPQSVLIGIENLRYFYKYRLFLQTDRRHSLRFLFVYIALKCPLKQTNFAT